MLLQLRGKEIFPVNPSKTKTDFRDALNLLSPTLFSLANEPGFNKPKVCVIVCVFLYIGVCWLFMFINVYVMG